MIQKYRVDMRHFQTSKSENQNNRLFPVNAALPHSLLEFGFQISLNSGNLASANVVFHVKHKFHDHKKSLDAILHHDCHRHKRILAAAEIPLGGDITTGLYFTKIQIGSPPKDFHVQVDTGSDILWVACIKCDSCPKKSDLGVPLTLYNPHDSSTAKKLTCDDDFCKKSMDTFVGKCKAGTDCLYTANYGDGSGTSGYFINDNLQLLQASGGGETKYVTGNITFGCATKLLGELESSEEQAVDGMLGLGQWNSSLVSQFASEKKVKRMFSHCLSGSKGGGIFAIGEVVEPKVKTTKLLENKFKYNIVMKSIDVNGETLDIPKSKLDSGMRETATVDSGTTLAYFPSKIYNPLMQKIMAAQPDKKPIPFLSFKCYVYSGNIDEGFPNVTLHFDDSLSLTLTPHQYFFEVIDDRWCIGFQENTFESGSGGEQDKLGGQILLGDLVLANRLVTYDIENKAIGWVDHDCSTTIKVKDEESGNVFDVHATHIEVHPTDISSARRTSNSRMILGLLLFLAATLINRKN